MAASGIYEIVNLVNGKRYIGSAKVLHIRRRDHFTQLRKRKHVNRHLQASFNKHAEKNFEFRVLCTCSPQELIPLEQIAIDTLNPEYNICRKAGSTLGVKRTPEQCAAQSVRRRALKLRLSPEARAKISAAHKGRKLTPEHLAKIKVSWDAKRAAGWKPDPDVVAKIADKLRGRKASPETRAKLSASRRGKPSPLRGRKISSEHLAKLLAWQAKNGPTFQGKQHSEATKAELSRGAKQRWEDPEYRERMLAALLTEESLARRAERMRGNKLFAGRTHSEATKQRLREIHTGRTFSEETLRKMSEAHKGFVPSDATRAIWRKQRSGLGNPAAISDRFTLRHLDGRQVTGVPMELRTITGISPAGMSQLINGKQDQAKGWSLAPPEQEQRYEQSVFDFGCEEHR